MIKIKTNFSNTININILRLFSVHTSIDNNYTRKLTRFTIPVCLY